MRGENKSFVAALALIVAVAALAGCSATASPKQIEAIGVVASQDRTFNDSGADYLFKFDDGRTFTLHYSVHQAIQEPRIGDLIIAGTKPDNWLLIAPLRVPDPGWKVPCYGLVENGEEHDTTVELDFGVTLQKAPDFEEGGRNPKNSTRITGGVICLNRDGQVRRIY
jgi:hypothetical protein